MLRSAAARRDQAGRRAASPAPARDARAALPVALAAACARWSAVVSVLGIVAGVLGIVLGHSEDVLGLVAIVALVGIGQALALEVDEGSISVAAVGAIAGAALFGAAGLRSRSRSPPPSSSGARAARRCTASLFNVGALTLASLGAAGVFSIANSVTGHWHDLATAVLGLGAGAVTSRQHVARSALRSPWKAASDGGAVWQERFAWLMPHYVVYGFVGGVMAIAYQAAGLVRARRVRGAAAADAQDAGRLPLAHAAERPEAARRPPRRSRPRTSRWSRRTGCSRSARPRRWSSLSATVDARDAYTAGHSRRVQRARARDRPRARALAGGARPARARRALPRHRQACDPRRDPAEARDASTRRSGR